MITWRSVCIAIIALIGVLVVRAFVTFFQQCWALRNFRGPLAFPIVGNCYDPKAIIFLRFLTSLRSRYGRVFTFFNFTKSFLVVCEPGLIRQILSDSKTFYKGSDYTAKFGRFFGEGLVTSNGEKHKKDRSMLMKFFARPNVLKYAQSINDVTIAAVKEFLPTVNGDVQINVEEMYATMTLRNFMRFCCSMDFSDNQTFERKLCHMISQGSNSVGRIITFNLPLNPLIPHVARADKVVKTLVEVFTPIVGARRTLVASGTAPSDPLTQMVSHGLSDREIFEHLQTLVCAGHDTTAYFLSYMTYMLAMNPDKQEKLHRCLQEIGGTIDYFVEPDALAKCQYLQYVMMETLRLFAVIPAVSRVASKDVEFKDFNVTIPQGTNILIPFFVVNRDPELWENPVQFCPERFEGRGIDFTSAKDGFFPFSYGSRTCIGNMFAHVEAEIVISHLLLRYRFAADPTFKPIVTAGISLTTANGMRVIVQPR